MLQLRFKVVQWQWLHVSIAVKDKGSILSRYLEELEKKNPILILPYCYHMYMAMLAGGMMIKKLVKRSFTRSEGQGVNCFAFRVKSNKTLRDKLKDAINTTSRDEETTKLLLTESVNCFKMNNQVVRSLEGTGNHVMNFILKWTIIVSLIFVIFLAFAYNFSSQQ